MPTGSAVASGQLGRALRRGALLWLLVRAAVTGLASALPDASGTASPAWALSLPAALLVVLLVGALAQIDARVMREPLFHANLGVPTWSPAVTAAVVALLFEVVVGALS